VRTAGRRRDLRWRASGVISAAFIVLLIGIALGASFIAPHDPTEVEITRRNLPPVGIQGSTSDFLLGTDPLGRDVLSRLIHSTRVSLLVGFAAVAIQGVAGVTAGMVAGYRRGWTDTLIMRLVDIQLGIPFLVLAIAAAAALGGGLVNMIIVLSVTGWVQYARIVRGETLSLREREFILATKVIGCGIGRVLVKHLVPNLMSTVLVLATFQVSRMIIAEASLSFLGLGIQPPTPSWGGMAADGRDYLASAWWVATLPGLAIAATSLAINFAGDWLRDILDPTLADA
jgi:peptide/nickel transport system permease protein